MPKGLSGCDARGAGRWFSILIAGVMSMAVSPRSQGQPAQATQPARQESRFSRGAEAEITFQEGLLQYTRKQLPEAEENFKKVIQADSNDAQAYYYLGLAQLDQSTTAGGFDQKRVNDAIENFNTALRLDPTLEEVRAARATAYIRAQRYDQAREDIDRLAPNPRWESLVHYLRGQIAFNQGDLDAASREFAAAKAAGGTEAAPASFYEGLTYLKLRQNVLARAAFQQTTVDPQSEPSAVAAARQLDAALAAQQATGPTKRWSAAFTLSYVYDTNVVQLGNTTTPGSVSNQSDSRIVLQPSGSYSFIRTDKLDVAVQASGYFAYQFDLNDFDIYSYAIGPVATYKLAENISAGLSYTFNYIEFGHDPYLNRNIITPSLTIVEPKFGYTQAYYQFEARQFQDHFTDTGLDLHTTLNRDGQDHTLGLTQAFITPEIFKDAGSGKLELAYRITDQETKGSDYDGLFNQVGLTFYTPLPFWKLRADAGVNYEWDDYRHPNSLDTGAHHERFDQIWTATVGVTKPLNNNLSVRVDYTYTNSDSNVRFGTDDLYDYDRHQVAVRLICTF